MKRRNFFGQAALASTILPMLGNQILSNQRSDSLKPFLHSQTLESTRQAPGALMNFICSKEQTGGQFSLIEGKAIKGAEPRLHVHENEDEAFFLLDGEMIATVGDQELHLKPGNFTFLPRKIPHKQKFITESVHVLILITPAGLEKYFWDITKPVTDFSIPPITSEPPSQEIMQKYMELNKKYGISRA